jgi:hypothetical protein
MGSPTLQMAHFLLNRCHTPYRRRFYELCVMAELKNALRSGDVSVRGSRQFQDFEILRGTGLIQPITVRPNAERSTSYSSHSYITLRERQQISASPSNAKISSKERHASLRWSL